MGPVLEDRDFQLILRFNLNWTEVLSIAGCSIGVKRVYWDYCWKIRGVERDRVLEGGGKLEPGWGERRSRRLLEERNEACAQAANRLDFGPVAPKNWAYKAYSNFLIQCCLRLKCQSLSG